MLYYLYTCIYIYIHIALVKLCTQLFVQLIAQIMDSAQLRTLVCVKQDGQAIYVKMV